MRRPVLVYGVLEGFIGITALLVPALLGAAQLLFITLFGGQQGPVAERAQAVKLELQNLIDRLRRT